MTTDDDRAREYLRDALAQAGVEMKTASVAVGMNHAYIQQYIRTRKPRWLPEQIRNALVRLYRLDDEKLRPPALNLVPSEKPRRDSKHQTKIDAQRLYEIIHDPRQLDLLDIWSRIPKDRHDIALTVLRSLAGDQNPAGDESSPVIPERHNNAI